MASPSAAARVLHLHRPPLTMASPSGAARVFAVTELLQEVLVQVGLEEIKRPSPHLSKPATTLFVLQRVNRTFQAAMNSSPILRQLMCLDLTAVDGNAPLNAICWLVRASEGSVTLVPSFAGSKDLKRYITATWETPSAGSDRMTRDEASWRNMKVPRMTVLLERRHGPWVLDMYTVEVEKESTLGVVDNRIPMQLKAGGESFDGFADLGFPV